MRNILKLAVMVVACLVARYSGAATLTWDVDALTSGAQDGTGVWNAVTANWWDGSTNVAWVGANSNTVAVLGAGVGDTNAYAISVPGALSCGGLVFQDQAYTLNGGANLTLNGGITNNAPYAAITGHLGFTSQGASVFNLASNTTLALGNSAAHINDSYYATVAGSGTLTIGGNAFYIGTMVSNSMLVVNSGAGAYAGVPGGFGGNLIINPGGLFQNAAVHIFANRNSQTIWINGGTLQPAADWYVPTTIRMTGGTWANGGSGNRFSPNETPTITTDATNTTALIASSMYFNGGGTVILNVGAGSVVGGAYPGVDLEFNNNGGFLPYFNQGGTRSAIKAGAGLMEMNVANIPMNGQLTVSGGTLRLTGLTSFSGSGITVTNAGSLVQLNAANAGDNLISASAAYTLAAGAILSKTGPGKIQFAPGGWTSSGSVTVEAGTLYISNNRLAAQAVVVNGGFLAGSNAVGDVTVAVGGGIEGGYTGNGSLTLASLSFPGAGKVQGYLGTATPVVVTGGVTASGGDQSIAITCLNLPASGTYHFLSYGSGADPFSAFRLAVPTRSLSLSDNSASNSIDVIVDSSAFAIWTGALSGEWSTNTLSAPKNWVVSVGGQTDFLTLDNVVFDDTATGTTAVTLNSGNVLPGSVTFNNSTLNYTLSGAGSIASSTFLKNGAGSITLGTSNTFSSAIVSNGTLVVANNNAINSNPANSLTLVAGTLQAGGAAISLPNNFTISGDVVLNGGAGGLTLGGAGGLGAGTRTLTVSNNVTLGGSVTVSNLVKTGSGTLILAGANTVSGGTTISRGQVTMNNVNAAGSGVITLGDAASGANTITLSANVGGGNFTNAIVVSSNGTGVVTLRGDQSYLEFAGSIVLNRATTLGGSVGDRYGYSGQISGNVGTLTVTGTPRITFDQSVLNSNTFVGAVVISSSTTLQLNTLYGLAATNAVTANGALRVITGVVGGIANIGALNGSGWVHGDTGGGNFLKYLALGGDNGNGTFSGLIYNGGGDTLGIIKNGSGTQTLTGANTYSGATIVSNGVVKVNNASGSGTGTGVLNVSSNATLCGTGTVAGVTTIAAGGVLSPGDPDVNGGIGRLNITTNVTLASGSALSVQITTNSVGDKVTTTGTATINGANLMLSVLNDSIQTRTRFVVLSATNIIGMFNGFAEGGGVTIGTRRFVASYPGATNVVLECQSTGFQLLVQ